MASETLDPTLLNDLKVWRTYFFAYGIGHYFLIITGILAGAMVTASSGSAAATSTQSFIEPIWTAVLGIIAAAAVAITNALDTGSQRTRFNKAWVHLNEAVMRYRANPTKYPIETVIDAWRTGQNIINEVAQEGQKQP
jgi:hypothetical protein